MKTTILLVALFHLLPQPLAVAEPTTATEDSFTQRDLKVALLLTTLHHDYITLDRMIAEGFRPEHVEFRLKGIRESRENELGKMVGLKTLLGHLKKSLSELEQNGLGPAHPQILWHRRLIKGLER